MVENGLRANFCGKNTHFPPTFSFLPCSKIWSLVKNLANFILPLTFEGPIGDESNPFVNCCNEHWRGPRSWQFTYRQVALKLWWCSYHVDALVYVFAGYEQSSIHIDSELNVIWRTSDYERIRLYIVALSSRICNHQSTPCISSSAAAGSSDRRQLIILLISSTALPKLVAWWRVRISDTLREWTTKRRFYAI